MWGAVPTETLMRVLYLWNHSGMTESPRTTDAEEIDPSATTIPVSQELRDFIRLEKTREDVNYDSWLRENLPVEA